MLPVAVDAMGGDHAPAEIVAGAQLCVDNGLPVVLVGRPDEIGDTSIEVIPASEAIAMDADPTKSVRTMKDSSLVRAAEAVRDGRACAMVSAGNTGAALTAATLRMRRLSGVGRPAIATPITSIAGGIPTILIDGGANVECSPDMLALFARMGAVFAKVRYGLDSPRVGLLANGEEQTKGSPLTKAAFPLLAEADWQATTGATFVGNVEGGDIFSADVDVVVTDGFTGNVALKTLEGSIGRLVVSDTPLYFPQEIQGILDRVVIPDFFSDLKRLPAVVPGVSEAARLAVGVTQEQMGYGFVTALAVSAEPPQTPYQKSEGFIDITQYRLAVAEIGCAYRVLRRGLFEISQRTFVLVLSVLEIALSQQAVRNLVVGFADEILVS